MLVYQRVIQFHPHLHFLDCVMPKNVWKCLVSSQLDEFLGLMLKKWLSHCSEITTSVGTECHPIFGQNWAALLRWPFWTDLKVYFRVGLQIKSLNSRFQQASRFSPVSSSSWVSQMDLHLLCHQLGSTWNINEHHGYTYDGYIYIIIYICTV